MVLPTPSQHGTVSVPLKAKLKKKILQPMFGCTRVTNVLTIELRAHPNLSNWLW